MNGYDQTIGEGRPPWKTIALVTGAAVVGVALIVGAVLFVRSRQKVEISTQNMDRVEAQLSASLAGCAQQPNPDECRRNKVLLAAQATGAASVCGQLAGADRDSCIWTISRERNDADGCALMEDKEKAARCSDAINAKLAVASKDAAYCDTVIDEARKATCVAAAEGPLTSANCADRGMDQATCDGVAAYEAAVASEDRSACDALASDDDAKRCNEILGERSVVQKVGTDPNLDLDGDGLTDVAETDTYHTDPGKTDTDGDGYSDKVEIDGGYNPNGPGRL